MRFLAALAFLLQLQPLAGSVICFHNAEMASAECTMPHEKPLASSSLTVPSTGAPSGCPSMGYCAPTAPAVPKFDQHFQIVSFVHAALALIDPSMAPGESPAPPFDPPRA
jgi:hypothetical protein